MNDDVFYISRDDAIAVIVNGEYFEIDSTPENEKAVRKIAAADDAEAARRLVDSEVSNGDDDAVRKVLEADDRLERDPETGRVFLQGDTEPMPQYMGDRILTNLEEDLPVDSIVNFWKNCRLNSGTDSKSGADVTRDLFEFLRSNGHRITQEGYFVAYKRVQLKDYYELNKTKMEAERKGFALREDLRETADVPFVQKDVSINHETGEIIEAVDLSDRLKLVDLWTGEMNNSVGEVVSMPREEVEHDPSKACAEGLHAASIGYIPTYGIGNSQIPTPPGTEKSWSAMSPKERYQALKEQQEDPIVEVLINPADVVSVPYNHQHQKLRCCRYYVRALFNGEHTENYDSDRYIDQRTKELREQFESRIEDQIETLQRERDAVLT